LAGSYFAPKRIAVATARSGNVIGGGDWSEDRLIPDVWRAVRAGKPLRLRNPKSTRPWQHVLEPLSGYLQFAERLARGENLPSSLNFGPAAGDVLTVAEVADAMLDAMQCSQRWIMVDEYQPEEARLLAIDPALARSSIGWRPRLNAAQALQWTATWYRGALAGAPPRALALDQIGRYEEMT
jgi:CDP-glucose 4,6-dehydratase